MKTMCFLRFFLVDLSRRKAVLLRGGPRRKGLGGIITYTFLYSPLLSPAPWSFLRCYLVTLFLAAVLARGSTAPR